MVAQGKNLMVFIPGDGVNGDVGSLYPIGCDQSSELTGQTDFIETTVKDNGYNKTFLPTTVSYQVTGNGLVNFTKVMNIVALSKYMDGRKGIVVKIILNEVVNGDTTTYIIWSGTGFFQQCQFVGAVRSAMTYSYTITITGGIIIDTVTMPSQSGGQPVTNMALVDKKEFRTTTDQSSYQNDVLIGASLLYLSVEGLGIFTGDGDDEMVGLDSTTGSVTWNFAVENLTRIIIVYKK